jgi:hypothetical protein
LSLSLPEWDCLRQWLLLLKYWRTYVLKLDCIYVEVM